MISITNGVDTLTVPNGAYLTQFKPIGWRPVSEVKAEELPKVVEERGKVKAEKEHTAKKLPGESERAITEAPEVEKPLNEMTVAELKAKAKKLGINMSGMTSKKQVRAAISEVINGK